MKNLILFILVFASMETFSQNINVQGKVIDEKNIAVPYASVGVVGTTYGTVTNLDGEFQLVVKEEDKDKIIAISFVGYETAEITADSSIKHTVILGEKGIELEGTYVLGLEPEEVILRFLDNIENNYTTTPSIHKAFLREKEMFKEGNDIYLSELLVDYLRDDYSSTKKDKMKIVKGRNFHYMDFDSINYIQPSGGLFDIGHDLVKYPDEFIKASKLYKFVYEFDGAFQNDDNKLIYKIKFTPATTSSKYQGFLYFEEESYALVKAEVGYTPWGMEWLNADRWTAESMTWSEMNKTITYKKQQDNQYYLSEVIINGEGKNHSLGEDIVSLTELVMVDIDIAPVNTNGFQPISKHEIISDLEFKNSPAFWGANNFIKRENEIVGLVDFSLRKVNFEHADIDIQH